ncbi:uncharacterized protein YehS (DUF1456 family) [Psychrobacillus insolitus]|uniref:Uncharacterized protein YehS (DUF1456 family) n=1 Tax=Psychrobacillus insolitus TaxID=1461 RepID=A0A2W7MML4_9BACI|nr:DUF1456 family protein [Psychrobacillus insolitus]PZX03146.1 uncharacterized protein YehS (DUF1456 family) [Psychrobacillus insolitus]
MENNDILIRLRYALDIKNKDMVEIFKLGGVEVSKEDVLKILTKSKDEYDDDEEVVEDENHIKCNNKMLESFLNGFITHKRGKQDPKPEQEQPANAEPVEQHKDHVNNMLLKKLKVALQLTTEDMLDILHDGGIVVSKGELGAILRKSGHRNYKECGDNFARKFLKGLAVKYRS